MAKKLTGEQRLIKLWWMQFLLALVFLGLSYGFFSLAFDSAHTWEYVLGVVFLVMSIKYFVHAARSIFSK